MKRPAVLIVGAVAGALVVAGVGASAHTAFFLNKASGLHSAVAGDEASGARVEPAETPEPTDTPEAPPTAEPTEQPEPADNDKADNDNETADDGDQKAAPATSGGDHGGDHQGGGGDGEHGD
jgi:hypothetical protein